MKITKVQAANKIDVAQVGAANFLMHAYNAVPKNRCNPYQYVEGDMGLSEARDIIALRKKIDWLKGRPIMMDFSSNMVDPSVYDSKVGHGTAASILEELGGVIQFGDSTRSLNDAFMAGGHPDVLALLKESGIIHELQEWAKQYVEKFWRAISNNEQTKDGKVKYPVGFNAYDDGDGVVRIRTRISYLPKNHEGLDNALMLSGGLDAIAQKHGGTRGERSDERGSLYKNLVFRTDQIT